MSSKGSMLHSSTYLQKGQVDFVYINMRLEAMSDLIRSSIESALLQNPLTCVGVWYLLKSLLLAVEDMDESLLQRSILSGDLKTRAHTEVYFTVPLVRYGSTVGTVGTTWYYFLLRSTRKMTCPVRHPSPPREAPPSAALTQKNNAVDAASTGVMTAGGNSAGCNSDVNEKNGMPLSPNQMPAPGQRMSLPTKRMESTIPNGKHSFQGCTSVHVQLVDGLARALR